MTLVCFALRVNSDWMCAKLDYDMECMLCKCHFGTFDTSARAVRAYVL